MAQPWLWWLCGVGRRGVQRNQKPCCTASGTYDRDERSWYIGMPSNFKYDVRLCSGAETGSLHLQYSSALKIRQISLIWHWSTKKGDIPSLFVIQSLFFVQVHGKPVRRALNMQVNVKSCIQRISVSMGDPSVCTRKAQVQDWLQQSDFLLRASHQLSLNQQTASQQMSYYA